MEEGREGDDEGEEGEFFAGVGEAEAFGDGFEAEEDEAEEGEEKEDEGGLEEGVFHAI